MTPLPVDHPDWHHHAPCNGLNPDLFFPEQGHDATNAIRVCQPCPYRQRCLTENLGEKHGVFGGTTVEERTKMRMGHLRALPTLRDLPPPRTPPGDLEGMIGHAAEAFGVTVDYLTTSRTKPAVNIRQITMAAIRQATEASFPAIAAAFGKDHTTVVHACQKRADDPLCLRLVSSLRGPRPQLSGSYELSADGGTMAS